MLNTLLCDEFNSSEVSDGYWDQSPVHETTCAKIFASCHSAPSPATSIFAHQILYKNIKKALKVISLWIHLFGSVQCGKSCKKHDEMKKLRLIKVSVDNEICNL